MISLAKKPANGVRVGLAQLLYSISPAVAVCHLCGREGELLPILFEAQAEWTANAQGFCIRLESVVITLQCLMTSVGDESFAGSPVFIFCCFNEA